MNIEHLIKTVKTHLERPKQLVLYETKDFEGRTKKLEFKSFPDLNFVPKYEVEGFSVADGFATYHLYCQMNIIPYEMSEVRKIILYGEKNG